MAYVKVIDEIETSVKSVSVETEVFMLIVGIYICFHL